MWAVAAFNLIYLYIRQFFTHTREPKNTRKLVILYDAKQKTQEQQRYKCNTFYYSHVLYSRLPTTRPRECWGTFIFCFTISFYHIGILTSIIPRLLPLLIILFHGSRTFFLIPSKSIMRRNALCKNIRLLLQMLHISLLFLHQLLSQGPELIPLERNQLLHISLLV